MVRSWRKCSQLWYESAANQRTIVEIECSATVGWKWGYQPFSCPCSHNVTRCRKEICSTCLFKTYIPAVPFWNSKHLLLTRSRFPRATVRSTSSALCLHYAWKRSHSFVEDSGFVCDVEKHRFGHGVVVSKICYVQYSDCVQDLDYRVLIALSVVTCDCCKPTNHCRDWAFSHSGLEAGLPAFQLPMYSMWDALPKKVLFHMFVSGIHAFCEI